MAYEPHLIAPFEQSGLKKWYKPWITGPTAFPEISDAYARRGVVRKREGYQILASLPAGDAPVQGLKNWINPSTLGEYLIAFSRTKSYLFNDITQTFNDVTFDPAATPFSWSNGANDYFWTSNYAGSMWTTNNLTADHIKYWNITNNWTTFQPIIDNVGTTLNAALIILPYKGRLVVLNTTEGTTNFQNRARFSARGTPYTISDATHIPAPGFDVNPTAWRSDIPGQGGFVDADTSERIVSAAIVKDTLIVAFQRSTWRLRYLGGDNNPFAWERLNTQYGAESTYSNISFDESVLFFSRYGWIGSDTNDVARIDLDIPDDSFAVEGGNTSLNSLNKIQGIRDFFRNFAYWTYVPIAQEVATKIYGYNYIDKSWTILNPSVPINVFGSYRNTSGDKTWSFYNVTGPDGDQWYNFNSPDDIWSNFGTGQNQDFPYIVGGDLSGNVYTMFEFFNPPGTDNGTPFNFTITTKRVNPYLEKGQKCRLGYVDLYLTTLVGGEITLEHFVDDQESPVVTKTVELFSRGVSAVTNLVIGTPSTITTANNHNLPIGTPVLVTLTDFNGLIGSVLNNTITLATAINATQFTITSPLGGYVYDGGGLVYGDYATFQGDAKYVRVYLGAIARMHQISLTLSDNQLADPVKGSAQFEMQGMVWWTKPTGRIRG